MIVKDMIDIIMHRHQKRDDATRESGNVILDVLVTIFIIHLLYFMFS